MSTARPARTIDALAREVLQADALAGVLHSLLLTRHVLFVGTSMLDDDLIRIAHQVRTVLQHAWAEFEHDIRYKGTVPAEHASEFDRRFTLAAPDGISAVILQPLLARDRPGS